MIKKFLFIVGLLFLYSPISVDAQVAKTVGKVIKTIGKQVAKNGEKTGAKKAGAAASAATAAKEAEAATNKNSKAISHGRVRSHKHANKDCDTCKGQGTVICWNSYLGVYQTIKCPNCNGTGRK